MSGNGSVIKLERIKVTKYLFNSDLNQLSSQPFYQKSTSSFQITEQKVRFHVSICRFFES